MKKSSLLLICTFVIGFVLNIRAQENPPANKITYDVIAGKKLGSINLGDPSKTVIAIYGEPTKKYNKSPGIQEFYWDLSSPNDDNYEDLRVIIASDRVIQAGTTLSQFKLPGGYSTNTILAQVFQKYKNLKLSVYGVDTTDGGYEAYFYDDIKGGVAFMIGVQDNFDHSALVDRIYIHRPNKPVLSPINSSKTKPSLNKPDTPGKITPHSGSLYMGNGLPITENLSPRGVKSYTTHPFLTDKGIGMSVEAYVSIQGKRITPKIFLMFASKADYPKWSGLTYITLKYNNKRLRLQGRKNTLEPGNNSFVETLLVSFPLKEFLEIPHKDLSFEVGGISYTIDQKHLAGIFKLQEKVK